ncbi:unnamed protein product, partial [Cuscuta campestris]
MAKAFDKISWSYLKEVLKSFGFNDHCIALLLQNLEATHISLLINGSPHGFFKIKRGVKQGDPLSPLLFIIGSEGFSRSLNYAISSGFIAPFKAGKSQVVSHLAFADDLLVFLKGDLRNMLRFNHILHNYLRASGQEINSKKSKVFCKKNSHWTYKKKLEEALGFMVGSPPFKYLGSTITTGKLKRIHCDQILNHFDAYLNSWYNKELNPMSRLFLIKHVLSAIPLHTLAVQDLPRSVITVIQGKLANFFWGSNNGKNKYHWAKWTALCKPTGEGGLGLRSLEDIQKASALKLWWKVINGDSIWSKFMKDKYYRDGLFEAKLVEKSNHEDRWTMSEDDTLCLMAKDDANQEFKKMMVDFEEINLKHSSLTEENKLLSEENLKLTEDRKSQLNEITQLKTENESLSEKIKSLNKELGILKSKEAVDKLLKTTNHKGREGLGFDSSSSKRKGRTTFIPPKPTAKSNKQKGKEKKKPTEVPKK